MRLQTAWFVSVILFSSGVVFADAPPSWPEFDTRSPNGRYLAEVRAKEKPEGAPRWAWQYQITVFGTRQTSRQPIWSCAYTHDGYGGGYLSDDGSTFAYVNPWYERDGPVVWIYRHGKRSGVLFGREFNIRESALVSTVSHQLWIDDSASPNVRFVQTGTLPLWLEIATIDKQTHLIDVESGNLVKP